MTGNRNEVKGGKGLHVCEQLVKNTYKWGFPSEGIELLASKNRKCEIYLNKRGRETAVFG